MVVECIHCAGMGKRALAATTCSRLTWYRVCTWGHGSCQQPQSPRRSAATFAESNVWSIPETSKVLTVCWDICMFCSVEESEATAQLRAAIEEHLGESSCVLPSARWQSTARTRTRRRSRKPARGWCSVTPSSATPASQSAGSPAHSW
jgi:hypothetical protein